MKKSKLELLKDNNSEIYDILFIIESEEYNYIAFTTNKIDKENMINVHFAKYKEANKLMKNLTDEENVYLNKILQKFSISSERG